MEELELFDRRLKLIDGEIYSLRQKDKWVKIKACKDKDGYLVFSLQYNHKIRQFKYHRVIYKFYNRDWEIMNSSYDNQIDHIDLNTSNNVIENLRIVNAVENQQNRTDVKGYYYNKSHNLWRAHIQFNGKRDNLGYFKTEAEAKEARRVAVENLYTHSPL